jgi:hypothetical protein
VTPTAIVTALTIVLGIPDGSPAQTIEREWPALEGVTQERDAACRDAQAAARKALQEVMERNASFVVSITCRMERKL